MKKFYRCLYFSITFYFLGCIQMFSQPQCYLQLYPGDNGKIIFQILPDKDYTDVAIYVNFYDNANNPIKLNAKFPVTNYQRKYLLQSNGVQSFILNHNFKNVDHISLGGIYEKVPSLELQKDTIYFSLDDGDMAKDASYAAAMRYDRRF